MVGAELEVQDAGSFVNAGACVPDTDAASAEAGIEASSDQSPGHRWSQESTRRQSLGKLRARAVRLQDRRTGKCGTEHVGDFLRCAARLVVARVLLGLPHGASDVVLPFDHWLEQIAGDVSREDPRARESFTRIAGDRAFSLVGEQFETGHAYPR